jgi:hypothetical protein
MQVARCHLALALSVYSALLVVLAVSASSALVRLQGSITQQDCSVYSRNISFQIAEKEAKLQVFASFSDFEASICSQINPPCPSFCDHSTLFSAAGTAFLILTTISVLLCSYSVLRAAARIRGKWPQSRFEELLQAGILVSCLFAGTSYWVLTRELGEAGVGLQACWGAVLIALIGAVHSLYMKKGIAPGLHRVRSSELEGTNIDPARAREDGHLEYTTESAEEKKVYKHVKEIESLKERLENEESTRKSLLSDNQQLIRQVEEREKTLRELEQKSSRTHQNVQVTAALSLAKQKEDEVNRLIGRLRDAEERSGVMGKLVEEMKGKIANEEMEKRLLEGELERFRSENEEKQVENVSILKDELQAARTEIREKEREMSLILRTAQNRESEEVQSLTAELAATNSRESEWNSYKGRLEEELETLKRENAALKETLSGLNPA